MNTIVIISKSVYSVEYFPREMLSYSNTQGVNAQITAHVNVKSNTGKQVIRKNALTRKVTKSKKPLLSYYSSI